MGGSNNWWRALGPALLVLGFAGTVHAEDPASTAAPAATDAQASLERELLSAEESVDSMKERVFRAKATLQLLQEIVIEGATGASRGTFSYQNKLGTDFTVESLNYLVDGQARFTKTDTTGALDNPEALKVFEGPLTPGSHNVQVELRLRPTGYSLFRYARSYTIDVRSAYSFEAEVGKLCSVKAVATDRGGAVKSLEERAKVDFDVKCEKMDAAAGK